jgi:hypothetical protein
MGLYSLPATLRRVRDHARSYDAPGERAVKLRGRRKRLYPVLSISTTVANWLSATASTACSAAPSP